MKLCTAEESTTLPESASAPQVARAFRRSVERRTGLGQGWDMDFGKRPMATYGQIQDWVQREHGFRPKTCWIAHCKELKGLRLRTVWNRGGGRQEPCPAEKRPLVFAAFRHFGMAE